MKTVSLAFAGALLATAVMAQTATVPGDATATPGTTSGAPPTLAHPGTGSPSSAGVVNRNTGSAAASGDRNQAVATTSVHAPQPAHGANSFSMGEARRRLASHGFQDVADLKKDGDGVWRGTGKKAGQQVDVWLDYKGNVGQQ